MVLATVSGVIAAAEAGGGVEVGAIAKVLGLSLGFLLVAVTLGRMLVPYYFRLVSRLRSEGILLATSLVMCFGFASLAGMAGLAPIVGAFTAGLILEQVHYQELSARHDDVSIEHALEG
jgi:Kef-type K+ transport system membrane component KefB